MKKQTAVEWIELKLNSVKPIDFCSIETIKDWVQQAKEMHKQEIMNAWEDGHDSFSSFSTRNAEQYHKETFGGTDII